MIPVLKGMMPVFQRIIKNSLQSCTGFSLNLHPGFALAKCG